MASAQEVARQGLDAFNAHDEARLREVYADNAVVEAPGDVRLEGGDATAEYSMSWFRAFPDAKIEVVNEIASGDTVALEITFEGTHENPLTGPEGEIPATGRHVKGRGAQVLRVEGGKVVEEHLYFDQVELMTQLGLMPEPAQATG